MTDDTIGDTEEDVFHIPEELVAPPAVARESNPHVQVKPFATLDNYVTKPVIEQDQETTTVKEQEINKETTTGEPFIELTTEGSNEVHTTHSENVGDQTTTTTQEDTTEHSNNQRTLTDEDVNTTTEDTIITEGSKIATTDKNVITANGIAPIEFAKEVFTKIELYDLDNIEKWFQLFKNGIWKE